MSKFTMKIYAWTRKQTWDPCKKIKSGALPLSFPGQYPQSIMIQGPKATKIKDVYTKKKEKVFIVIFTFCTHRCSSSYDCTWMRLRNPHPQCGAGTHFSFSHSTTTVPLPCRVWYTCSILSEVSPAWSLHRPSLSCHCHWPFFSPIKQMAFNVFILILLEGFFYLKRLF